MPKKDFLPYSYKRLRKEFPEIEKEYDRLAKKCHASGPLNEKMRRLIKLGIAIGSESEGAIKSHARRALAIGVTPEEIRHAVLLGLTTIGFPKMIAALNWVHEAFEEGPIKHRRGDQKKYFTRNALFHLKTRSLLKVTKKPFPSKDEMSYNFFRGERGF